MKKFNLGNTPIGPIHTDVMEAVCIIAQIQLASRHRNNIGASRDIAIAFAKKLQERVCEIAPENSTILEMGWNPDFDI